MRLGFAVAIHVDPDVLLVDEVLAVGDEGFTHKCLDKFAEFKRRGKTILLVTHSLGLVERFCDEALWLDGGRMKGLGDPKRDRRRLHHRRRAKRGAAARRRRRPRAGVDDQRSSPDEPASARAPRPPDRDRGERRPTCSARPKDAGDRARSRSPTCSSPGPTARPATCSTPASRSTIRIRLRAPLADRRLRHRHRPLQRRRGLLLRHQHQPRRADGRADPRRRGGRRSRSRASISSRAPTSWTSRSTSWTATRTTTTACCTRSA